MDGDNGVKKEEGGQVLEQPEGIQETAKKGLQISKKY